MFPCKTDNVDYDFLKEDNYERWKGTFTTSLGKVLEQLHPTLVAEEDALVYVEVLILMLMGKLCGKPTPHTVQDVEERVDKTFPEVIVKWALGEARNTTDKTKKKKPTMPVDKIHHMLQKEVFLFKIDSVVTTFIVGIIEYIAGDILSLAGNYVKKIDLKHITSQDIKTSMNADKALMEMFYQEQVVRKEQGAPGTGSLSRPSEPSRTPRASLTYEDLLRDLMSDEKHYLRDLHMIIRVFKEELEKILPRDSKDIDLIFGNIVEIYELTVTLQGSLEDTVESASETQMPHIGMCFEELAEAEEFEVYMRYAQTVATQESIEALQSIVDNIELSERLDTAGHGFCLAVKYYLPKLLASPLTHAFLYFEYVSMLLKLAPTIEDQESFQQVEGLMKPIQKSLLQAIGNGPKIEAASIMAPRARRQVALEKTNELAKLIENWDTKDIGQCCNEFIREDLLVKVSSSRRTSDRRAFLFDGLLLLCKPCPPRQELKLKEKLHIRKLDIIDKPDTDEIRNSFELSPRCGNAVILCCSCAADKNIWMADLVMLNTKSMLDRTLDSILSDLERKHPLKLPPPSLYRFAVPDSSDNIVLEERQNSGVPLIKGATLLKLVERLTYHIYADPMFVRTFLTTYRSFCLPPELLDLLIERFNIPDPSLVYDAPEKVEAVVIDTEKLSKNSSREDFKRYRKEFLQPVQFRVLNVLRHWVDQHYYDFERDLALLEKLKTFLDGITGKPMKKWVEIVIKILQRKSGGDQGRSTSSASSPPATSTTGPVCVFDRTPPPLESMMQTPHEESQWHILVLHPIELARQLTLLEFDLYRTVKPSELVGAVWTKKDKETSSPNLLKIIKHANNFTRWLEKSIVEAENLEERVAVLCRVLEVMMVLRELNNFNGILAIISAMGSAAVHRLKFTFQLLPFRLQKALEECRELNSDRLKKYQEKLRSINPPCVPFCGLYLTNILYIEDGNKDFISNTELINFSKRRMVAEITGEIQQYQNQPYCLYVEPKLRGFLEKLDPFPNMTDTEIRDYLYNKSLEIEPRNARQAPRFVRKWPRLSLKSPGIKPGRGRHGHSQSHISNNFMTGDGHGDIDGNTSQLSPTAYMWDGQSVASSSGFGSMASLQHDDDLSPRPKGRPHIRHSSMSSSCTFGSESSISPCLIELSTRMAENFSPASSISPKPLVPVGLWSLSKPSPPTLVPRQSNPALNTSNKGSNDSGAMSLSRDQTPPPPPRKNPSPDHQMVEFRPANGPKWPASGDSSFIHDSLPPRLPSSSTQDDKHIKSGTASELCPKINKPPALSPRNPIIDADSFYGTNNANLHKFENAFKRHMELNGDLSNVHDFNDLRQNKSPKPAMPTNKTNDDISPKEVDRTNKPVLLSNKTNGETNVAQTTDSEDPPPSIVPRRIVPQPSVETNKEKTSNGNVRITNSSEGDKQAPMIPDRVPIPSPRINSIYGSSVWSKASSLSNEEASKLAKSLNNQSPNDIIGDLFGRSEPSPKLTAFIDNELYNQTPPLSPHVNVPNSVSNYEKHHGIISNTAPAFSYPSLGSQPGTSPWSQGSIPTPKPSPTITHSSIGVPHTPPPLPPRKPKEPAKEPSVPSCSKDFPLQPSPTTPTQVKYAVVGPPHRPPRGALGAPPPPLPPRPGQTLPLLRPHDSTLLQRRSMHNNLNNSDGMGATPKLPPKPPQ